MQEILLNVESKEIRYAVLRNGSLQDLVVERKSNRQLTGNIYRGKVTNILNNIQSAFIDVGEEDNGFIHISDILENTQKFQEMFEMDFDFEGTLPKKGKKEKQETDITRIMKPQQPVLVQVVKEPIGTKGARLTSNISLAGRYLVLLPNTSHRGVSRKIEDAGARDQLKKLIRSFEMPKDMGLICRTASVSATPQMLIDEATELLNTWQSVIEGFHKSSRPTCLYEESDLIKRAVLTAVDKKFDRLVVDDLATFQRCKRLYTTYASEHPLSIELYKDKTPLFERFNAEKEIEKALKRKVWLPCGGYLFFDRTEAMYTVDVNSGRSSNQQNTSGVEETLVQINMEAAEEIARQLRIRNVGGLIICDFIDMRSRKNQGRVLDRLKEAMKEDSAKCTILGMSEFGLVEMTRQRHRESLTQTLFTQCPYCHGSGQIKSHESVAIEIERTLKKLLNSQQLQLQLTCHPELDRYLNSQGKELLRKMSHKAKGNLVFQQSDTLHLNEFQFCANNDGTQIDI